jgi:hypothetical protein
VVSGATTAIGWCAAQVFSWYKDSTARELNLRLKVVERQLEDFYGPLLSLTNQIEDARAARSKLSKAYVAAFKRGIEWNQSKMSWETTDDERKTWPIPDHEIEAITKEEEQRKRDALPVSTMRYYGLETFVYPLYEQVNKILAERIHLLDRKELPPSYREFMRHASMSRFQNRLFLDKKVSSNFISPPEYPDRFHADIREDLQKLREDYQRLQGQVAQAAKWRSAVFRLILPTGSPQSPTPQRSHPLQNS